MVKSISDECLDKQNNQRNEPTEASASCLSLNLNLNYDANDMDCNCQCNCYGCCHNQPHNQHTQSLSLDSGPLAVAVLVHSQESSQRAQSEQSLLNHSYEALQPAKTQLEAVGQCCIKECHKEALDDRDSAAVSMLQAEGEGESASGTCDEGMVNKLSSNQRQRDMMLGLDEITLSESDKNSTLVKNKSICECTEPLNNCNWHDRSMQTLSEYKFEEGANISVGHLNKRNYGGVIESASDNDISVDDNQRPPLPPRPIMHNMATVANSQSGHHHHVQGIRKYVVWCLVCGGFSVIIGIMFLGVYFLLHSYTVTVGSFETIPTFVPATLLILTGLCIMSLARRRNRYSYMIKLSGACGLITALTCALVTVTTTVLHMSRLQALRECEYAQKTRTCTCYSDVADTQIDRVDNSVRLVFDSLSDCSVVHGSLYSCLRAIFGLSIAGVLISVFSCMLVYQLLSHERKKMYWEQLELRCRSLYTTQQANLAAAANVRGPICRCCEQYHAHRQLGPLQTSVFPWEEVGEPRFWAGQQPGNYYSPNPGAEPEAGVCRYGITHARSRISGWSWPRLPWQRSSPDANSRFRQMPSSPDSQYGFSNAVTTTTDHIMGEEQTAAAVTAAAVAAAQHSMPPFNMVAPTALPYGVWGPPPPYSDPNSPARRNYYHYLQTPSNTVANAVVGGNNNNLNMNTTAIISTNQPTGSYVLNNANNHNNNLINNGNNININNNNNMLGISTQNLNATTNNNASNQSTTATLPTTNCEQTMNCVNYRTFMETNGNNGNNIITTADVNGFCDLTTKRGQFVSNGNSSSNNYKLKSDYENPPDNQHHHNHHHHHHHDNNNERFVNTLPARKVKKRFDIGAISIGPHVTQHHSQQRMHVQQVFATNQPTTTQTQQTTTTINDNLMMINEQQQQQQQNEMEQQHAQQQHAQPQQQPQRKQLRERVVLCKAPPPLPINRLNVKTKGGGGNNNSQHNNNNQQQSTPNSTPTSSDEVPSQMYAANVGVADSLANEESELYFADVSSCCNVSIKNDNFYEEANRRLQLQQHNYRQNNNNNNNNVTTTTNQPQGNNNNGNGNEDYLHQRINPHENLPRPSAVTRGSSHAKSDFYETPARCYTKPADPKTTTTTSTTTAVSQAQPACFVTSTYPRQTEIVHSYEARRLPTKQLTTHEAHYEIVDDMPCQFNSMRLMSGNRAHAHNHAHSHAHSHAHASRQHAHSMSQARMKRHHDLSALATQTPTNKTKATRNAETIGYEYDVLHKNNNNNNSNNNNNNGGGSSSNNNSKEERRRL